MNTILNFVDEYLTVFDVPGTRILLAALILIIALIFKRLFSIIVLKYLKKLTEKSDTHLDDALLEILNPPLSFLILLFGFYIATLVIGPVNERLTQTLDNFFRLGFVIIFCWLIYRSADVFSEFLQHFARRTHTDLDDILAPYIGKVVKIAAILIICIKTAEIFLGMSVGAIFGLLGGMGLTLGLVFKDIVANWFGCAVIYTDNLFREGDWVQLNDGSVIDADVEAIDLRSTKFRNFDKTVSIVPNSLLANGIVKNWSRMYKRRVKLYFRIDGIGAEHLEEVLEGIRHILSTDEEVHQEFHMVNFREVEGNARVIRLYYFTKTVNWKEHEQVRENINLKVLKLIESKDVDKLTYTIVDLSDDRPADFETHIGVEQENKSG